ncbi:hypothetical protein Bpfe_015619 [Biomphalaria pfeifferi]|uniref:Uncharacterized protein n=1 Tax=Biomphalaria pfeifferi TaxID=112525 RepID=A0AAD8BJ95_BIOPF|nr:hypothetical protein Bpfe_015619 [Biomphalaria pfeifferi]
MEPFGNHNRLAIGGAERSVQKGSEQKNDYFVDCLNVSCNSNDCSSYFDIPDCVTDVYLQALDGGDDSFAALRQISETYGDKDKKEYDRNCNMNNEPLPNQGCGCTGSYNGGAGGGTAVCDCDGKPYECGFRDKKRDNACCGYPNDKYRPEDVNVIPTCTQAFNKNCTCGASQGECKCQETYQQGLVNKKPECCVDYKYVAPFNPKPFVCDNSEPSGCQELVRKGKLPDRSNFYADDCCDCQHNNNNNNNLNVLGETDWAALRKSAYSISDNQCSTYGSNRVQQSDHSMYRATSGKLNGIERQDIVSLVGRSRSQGKSEEEEAAQATLQHCSIC